MIINIIMVLNMQCMQFSCVGLACLPHTSCIITDHWLLLLNVYKKLKLSLFISQLKCNSYLKFFLPTDG